MAQGGEGAILNVRFRDADSTGRRNTLVVITVLRLPAKNCSSPDTGDPADAEFLTALNGHNGPINPLAPVAG
jgi:hypothetical protein